jgi:hypothetical protein
LPGCRSSRLTRSSGQADRPSHWNSEFQQQKLWQERFKIRNGVRKLVGVNVSGGTVSLVCKLVTGGPNNGKYQLIVG